MELLDRKSKGCTQLCTPEMYVQEMPLMVFSFPDPVLLQQQSASWLASVLSQVLETDFLNVCSGCTTNKPCSLSFLILL